jgi:hypothetical protein
MIGPSLAGSNDVRLGDVLDSLHIDLREADIIITNDRHISSFSQSKPEDKPEPGQKKDPPPIGRVKR